MRQEMEYLANKGVLAEDQAEGILALYETGRGLDFPKLVLVLGAVLVGLGILSFIASNWAAIGRLWKFLMILALYLGTNYAGYRVQKNYPKVARSLYYLGIFIFGAGIMLVGQIFHVGDREFAKAFLFWGIGILPLALVLRDKWTALIACLMFFIYLNSSFFPGRPSLWPVVLIVPLLYYLNRFFQHSRTITFFNTLLALNLIFCFMRYLFRFDQFYACLIFLAVGLLLYFLPIHVNRDIIKLEGNIVIGIAGLFLTGSFYWERWGGLLQVSPFVFSIVFTMLYFLFLLWSVRTGSMTSLIFIALTVARLYFDNMYSFLPKSLSFIIVGLILLGTGFYIDKTRRGKELGPGCE